MANKHTQWMSKHIPCEQSASSSHAIRIWEVDRQSCIYIYLNNNE